MDGSGTNSVAADEIRSFIERVERLEEEKKTTSDDIKDVYGEAKGRGYDVKALRKIVQMRKQDPHERAEQEAVLDLYMQALGMTTATPDLPMQMERVRSKDRPKTGIEKAEAERQAEQRAAVRIDVTVAESARKRGKSSTKPKDADEARERLAALGPTFE